MKHEIPESEHLDFIFRHIETHQDTDKTLEEVLSNLTIEHPELAGFITRLLESQDDVENWFSKLTQNIDEAGSSDDFLSPGDQLGAYRIIGQIERGGMSQVYLAERADGEFEQKVAVKVMEAHLQTGLHKEFFRKEKTILASLNHPNVAQIFDSGIISSGQPYYIMEYVEGVPVDEYVVWHKLNLHQRLDIFLTICKAISFAHKNLIIHKDIKPRNIFVDTNGHVKLLDFGVADSLSQTDKTAGTDTLFMTKKYASPEMLRKEPVNISSDIYQLGLVMYKLLTGIHPKDTGYNSIIFPSDFKKYGEPLRNSLPDGDVVGRELEAIMNKALQENPDDRYDSVNGMQYDIESYIAGNPVETYSSKPLYLITKFIKRNKALSHTTGVFIAILVGLSLLYTVNLKREKGFAEENAERAEQQAARSDATVNYLKNLMYQSDPFTEKNSYSAKVLDSMAFMAYTQLEEDFAGQPKTKAEVYLVLADIFNSRSHYKESFSALHKARQLLEKAPGDDKQQKARAYYNLATTYINDGSHVDSSLYYIKQAIAIDSLNPSVTNNRLSYDLEILGRIYAVQNKYDSAVRYYSQSLKRLEQQEGREAAISRAGTLSMLGEIYLHQSRYELAEKTLKKALKMHMTYMGENNGYVANDISKLAMLYLKLNHYDKSVRYFNWNIRLTKNIYGENAPALINSYVYLSNLYAEKGSTDSTLYYGKRALEMAHRVYGGDHIQTARRYNTVGLAYYGSGMPGEAIKYFRKALDIKMKNHPDAKYSINITKYNLASALMELGEAKEAIPILEKVYAYEKKTYGGDHATVAITMRLLAQAYLDADQVAKARPLLAKAGAIFEKKYDAVHRRKAEYFITAAEMHLKSGDMMKSLKLANRAKIIFKELYEKDNWQVAFSEAFHGIIAMHLDNETPQVKEQYYHGVNILKNMQPKHQYAYDKIMNLQL